MFNLLNDDAGMFGLFTEFSDEGLSNLSNYLDLLLSCSAFCYLQIEVWYLYPP